MRYEEGGGVAQMKARAGDSPSPPQCDPGFPGFYHREI